MKLGDPGVELITPTLKIDGFATSSVEAGGAERRRSGRAPGVRRLLSAPGMPNTVSYIGELLTDRQVTRCHLSRAYGPKNVPVNLPPVQPAVPGVHDWPTVTVGFLGAAPPRTAPAAAAALAAVALEILIGGLLIFVTLVTFLLAAAPEPAALAAPPTPPTVMI